jgi:ADP-heptose:LPS heptosyltransferase
MITPRRILLILLRNIGDVVLTTPALRVLKQHFPEAEIDFVTGPAPAEILANNPHINETIIYPYKADDIFGIFKFIPRLTQRKYDISIDFLGTAATALMSLVSRARIRVGYNLRVRRFAYTHYDQKYQSGIYNALTKFTLLKPLGIEEEESGTEIFVTAEAKRWAEDFWKSEGWDEQVVAMATCAMRPVRCWLPERFADVTHWLRDRGYRVILTWGPGEKEYVGKVCDLMGQTAVMAPQTSLMQLAALLERCRLLVCNCSGTKHVAVAVGTPTLTIHGPSEPSVWTPQGDPRHAFVRARNLDCLPCNEADCEQLQCMEKVATEQVIKTIEKMGIID